MAGRVDGDLCARRRHALEARGDAGASAYLGAAVAVLLPVAAATALDRTLPRRLRQLEGEFYASNAAVGPLGAALLVSQYGGDEKELSYLVTIGRATSGRYPEALKDGGTPRRHQSAPWTHTSAAGTVDVWRR